MDLNPIKRWSCAGLCLLLSLILSMALTFTAAGALAASAGGGDGGAGPDAGKQKTAPLTLEKAYEIAFENNEQVAVSRQRLEQQRQDITIATSNLYPQISAQAGYTRQKVTDTSSGTGGFDFFNTPRDYGTLSFTLDQHIYQWGKVWSGRRIALYYFNSSKLRHIRQVQTILFNVSTRYYEVLLGRRAIEIAETALERARQQLDQAEARFNVGILTKTDVLRARVQVMQSQEQLERAKNQYAIAQENLALELGLKSAPDTIAEPAEKSIPALDVAELFRRALEHRRDYNQAKQQLRLTEERVDFEQADYFPNLSVEGRYTRTNEEDLYYGEHDDWQATLKLSYPLFTGWKTTAEVDKAKAARMEASAGLTRLEKEIRNDVRSVYLDIQTQKKVIAQLEEQVKAARRNYKQVTAQFEQGLVTAVDQIDAFTALNEAENRLAQAYYSYQLDQIRLKLAIGTFQTDLAAKELSDDTTQ